MFFLPAFDISVPTAIKVITVVTAGFEAGRAAAEKFTD